MFLRKMSYFRENSKKYYIYQSSKIFGFPFTSELTSTKNYWFVLYAYSYKHALKRFLKKHKKRYSRPYKDSDKKPEESTWKWGTIAIRQDNTNIVDFYE